MSLLSEPSDVLLGSVDPSLRAAPADSRANPQAADVVALASVAGLDLFEWQADSLVDALRLRVDVDMWAAREVAMVAARQNGKNVVLEVRQLAGLFVFGERLQIHSAHEFKTCYEHFRRIKGLIDDSDLLTDQVRLIRTGAGDQSIELKNGCRIRFIARSRSSGRGFTADVVYLDEAFELSPETIGALMPALSARPNPQVWYTSSAAHASSSVLHRLRERAVEGDDPRLLYLEWGNDPDVDPDDAGAVRRANPSLGLLISDDDVEAERRSMSPAEFARERLGVPDESLESQQAGPVDVGQWAGLVDGGSVAVDGSLCLALDVPPSRTSASFGLAGVRADGLMHVSVRYSVGPPAMKNLVKLAVELTRGHGVALVLPPNSPAKAWRAELEAAGVVVDELSPAEYAEACGAIQSKVLDGGLRHRGQPELDLAVGGLAARPAGDVETWSRRSSSVNIAPFVAVTCALARVVRATAAPAGFVDLDDFDFDFDDEDV